MPRALWPLNKIINRKNMNSKNSIYEYLYKIVAIIIVTMFVANHAIGEVNPENNESPAVQSHKIKVAVLNRPDQYNNDTLNILNVFQSELMNSLSENNKIIFIERQNIDEIIGEQKNSSKNIEPIVIGKLLGVDFFICLSLERSNESEVIETVLLNVNSADIVFSMKEKISGDDYSEAAEATGARILKKLPEIEKELQEDKNRTSVSLLSVYNKSKSDRLDYLEGILTEKTEDVINSLAEFKLLRRSCPNIARSETDLSYSGWVRPSDIAVAQYSDIGISIEFKEANNNGVAFAKTPIEVKVTLEGKKIDSQKFIISGSIDNLSSIFMKLHNELTRRLETKTKDKEDSEYIARKKEAQRLWKTLLQKRKTEGIHTRFLDKKGEISEYGKEILSELNKILFLDPGFKKARYELGLLYSQFSMTFDAAMTPNQHKKYRDKGIAEFELLLTGSPECTTKEYIASSYLLLKLYSTSKYLPWEKDRPPDEVLRLNRKLSILTRKIILKVPPEELPHGYLQRNIADYFFAIKDIEGAKQYFLFLDHIIGKNYYKKYKYNLYWGNCPLGIAIIAFSDHGYFKEAEFFLDLCKKTQPELCKKYSTTLEEYLYTKKGDKKKQATLLEKRNKAYKVSEKSSTFADELMTSPVKLLEIKLPESLFFHTDYLPKNGDLLVYKQYPDCEIYISGIPNRAPYHQIQRISSFFEHNYNDYQISIVDGKGNTVLQIPAFTKKGECIRITDCAKVDNFIYFTTKEGFIRYDMNSKEKKWFSEKEGVPYHFVSKIVRTDGLLWMTTGFFYNSKERNDYSIFSFDINKETLTTYFDKKKYVRPSIIDLQKYKNAFFVICDYYLLFFDITTGEWQQVKKCHPTSMAVRYKNEIWLGTKEGVGTISSTGFKKIFSCGEQKERELLYDNMRRLIVPIKSPILGKVTALASDGKLLWISSEKRPPNYTNHIKSSKFFLTAYDSTTDTWYGPFILPYGTPEMDVNSQGYLMFYASTYGMIKIDDLLRIAQENNLVRTSAEYREMVYKQFQDAGLYAQSIYAILSNQPKEEIMTLLNKAIDTHPEDYRALFWKGIYLGKRSLQEKQEAMQISKNLLKSDVPEYVKEIAKKEIKELESEIEKTMKKIKKREKKVKKSGNKQEADRQ